MRQGLIVLVVIVVLALALGIGPAVARLDFDALSLSPVAPQAWAWCGHWGAASVCVQATTQGWPQPAPSGTWYVLRCPPPPNR